MRVRDRWKNSKVPNMVASLGLEFKTQDADCKWKKKPFYMQTGPARFWTPWVPKVSTRQQLCSRRTSN